jgi:hypothetical protein
VSDTVCTRSGDDVTAYKTTGGGLAIGNILYNSCGGSTLVTGFYSDGSYRYIVNVGEITNIVACAPPSTTPTAQPTSTPTAQPTSTPTAQPTSTPTSVNFYWSLKFCSDNSNATYQLYDPNGNFSGNEVISGIDGNGITQCYYVVSNSKGPNVGPFYTYGQITEHSSCNDCQVATTPQPSPTRTPTPAAITATITGSNVSCNGGNNGSITVTNVSGGFGGTYQTKLNVGGTYTNWTSSTTYSTLTATSYTIYVKDSASREVTFNITITQPGSLGIFAQKTGFDQIYASVSGGASGFKTFELYSDNDTPYAIGGGTLVDTLYDSTSVTFNSVVAGYYYVKVTDGNGCTETTAYMITV